MSLVSRARPREGDANIYAAKLFSLFSRAILDVRGAMAAFLDAAVERLQVAITRDVPAYLKVRSNRAQLLQLVQSSASLGGYACIGRELVVS